jgi:hypothetical protein
MPGTNTKTNLVTDQDHALSDSGNNLRTAHQSKEAEVASYAYDEELDGVVSALVAWKLGR